MRMASLEALGAHPGMLAAWQRQYGDNLLPIQEKAVIEGGVLRGQNVVGSGPTGSGKTFIAEMAAAHAAANGRRAVYLVPTKALAEAKYRQFAATFGPLGIRVAISTQDRRGADRSIGRGDFDLAVTVPEKLWCLALASPSLVSTVGALVVDELQMVGDPDRGPRLELLISHFLNSSSAQLVGLSAVLSNGREVARWLRASLVEERRRPVELRKGVFREGRFHYLEHNSGATGEEDLAPESDEALSPLDAITALAAHLAERGESTLTFVRDRRSAVHAAREAAERLPGAPAERALESLRELPRTRATGVLSELLQSGVAFHTADLHFSERQVVEQAFADGEVQCLFATSTLAVGLNLPARNVIVEPLRWRTVAAGAPTLAPMGQSDFENMAGRAGRLEFGDAFGRAILPGTADFDSDMLMRRYVEAPPEPVEGQFARLPALQRLLLTTALSGPGADGYPPPAELSPLTPPASDDDASLARGLAWTRSVGLAATSPMDGSLYLTGLGRVAAASGLSLGTIVSMVSALQEVGPAPSNVEALIIAALSTEARSVALPSMRNERIWLCALQEFAHQEKRRWRLEIVQDFGNGGHED